MLIIKNLSKLNSVITCSIVDWMDWMDWMVEKKADMANYYNRHKFVFVNY